MNQVLHQHLRAHARTRPVLQLLRCELPVHFVNTEAAGKVRDRLTILSAT